jgi:ketosteroid isomerase-like protein
MRKDWDTLTLCDRFFDAIERKDYETLETCYGPEAVIWHSHDCLYQPRAANLAMLKDGMQRNKKTRFRDRRVHVFEGGFVQQHTIFVTQANDFVGRMDVCFVAYTRDGMISRAYEYFDTGQIEKFLGPRAGSQTAPDR